MPTTDCSIGIVISTSLLDCGANLQTRLRGATALHYTAKAGFLGATEVLLERGADVNAESDDGDTPLLYTLKAGKRADVAAMVKILIAKGADADHPNAKGKSIRTLVSGSRRADSTEILNALGS